MTQLELLIESQDDQEKLGNLTKTGIAYLDGLRTAHRITLTIPSVNSSLITHEWKNKHF